MSLLADRHALLRAGCPAPTPAEVRRAIATLGADCTVHDVMQSMPPGVEELEVRLLIARERLTHRDLSEDDKKVIRKEISAIRDQIAKASVGRRGAL